VGVQYGPESTGSNERRHDQVSSPALLPDHFFIGFVAIVPAGARGVCATGEYKAVL
jgi:hypothetical protein